MILKRLFCSHRYNKSMSVESETKGLKRYVYDVETYKCEGCKDTYKVKTLRNIIRNEL